MTEPSTDSDSGSGAGAGAGDTGPGAGPGPELTYEQARAELEDVVRRLEAGGVPLEESLALWERGEELTRRCQAWLEGARQRMQAVREAEPATPADEQRPA